MAGLADLQTLYETDSFPVRTFICDHQIDGVTKTLHTATIFFEVFRSKTSKTYLSLSSVNPAQITIINPDTCELVVQSIDSHGLTHADHYYRLRAEWSDGYKKTFLTGKLPVRKVYEPIKPVTI